MTRLLITLFIAAALVASCSSSKETSKDDDGTVTTASGLKYIDLEEGTGYMPQVGQTCVVHYHGTLLDGTVFDSSKERGQPYEFVLGGGKVIKGWEEGFLTMKLGGKRRLIVPAELGYGSRQMGNIPPNSTLIFDVELLNIKSN
ncbi:MAG: FKBP-type peptidyl-prolyl cis-trans isomerase [Candidatus Kapabacteria bacterium]|jgi:peptidylprolyl isomerase|nr:FKBP-type peptidyl-prolyl cis-trans isomerase [Candidatus Kapabacteria bacterium]